MALGSKIAITYRVEHDNISKILLLQGGSVKKSSTRFSFLRDPWFYTALAAGIGAWLLPVVRKPPGVGTILALALAEEIIFRYGAQHALGQLLRKKTALPRFVLPGISPENIAISAVFCAMHLFSHSPVWAAAVFIPSLIFGILWDRHANVLPCWIVHAAYNLLYFYRAG